MKYWSCPLSAVMGDGLLKQDFSLFSLSPFWGIVQLCSCAVVLVCARHKGNCAEAEFNISLTQQPPCLPVCTSLSSLFGKSKHQGHSSHLFGKLLVTISIKHGIFEKACKELKMWLGKSLISIFLSQWC